MIRLLIVDDDPLVRAGLTMMLAGLDDLRVVAEAADGTEVAAAVAAHAPDIVLMDIRMPRMDGLAATERIAADERLAGIKIVILTTFEEDEYIFAAVHAGASGFLVKDTEPVELLRAVRVAAAGEALLSPSVTRRLIEEFATKARAPKLPRGLSLLTEREREVVSLVGLGLSNEEIADRLVVSPATAKTHVSRAMIKLGARDRAQVVVIAYESGLVRPGWS